MNTLNIIHFGTGNIGNALINMIVENHERIKSQYHLDLQYCGFFDSKSGYYYPFGFPFSQSRDYKNKDFAATPEDAIEKARSQFVVIDTTASNETLPWLHRTLDRGGYVVLSNKRPLTGTLEQYLKLRSYGNRMVLFETAVAAGLPVIQTLDKMILTGDEIVEIEGCVSGTMGLVCTLMEEGVPFSKAVMKAQELRHTERDPREDLSGEDTARKALILARIIGSKLELADVKRHAMCDLIDTDASEQQFVAELEKHDEMYRSKFAEAKNRGCTYRYVIQITTDNIETRFQEVDKHSYFARVNGPENLLVIKSKRAQKKPLLFKGPAGDMQLAAASLLGDLVSIGAYTSL